jgi:hypothetical protein
MKPVAYEARRKSSASEFGLDHHVSSATVWGGLLLAKGVEFPEEQHNQKMDK